MCGFFFFRFRLNLIAFICISNGEKDFVVLEKWSERVSALWGLFILGKGSQLSQYFLRIRFLKNSPSLSMYFCKFIVSDILPGRCSIGSFHCITVSDTPKSLVEVAYDYMLIIEFNGYYLFTSNELNCS